MFQQKYHQLISDIFTEIKISELGSGGAIPWELWDRKNDPYELNNMADDPGYYPLISDLVQQMWKEWMLPTNDDYFYDRTLSGLREEYLEYDEGDV